MLVPLSALGTNPGADCLALFRTSALTDCTSQAVIRMGRDSRKLDIARAAA